jgi:hypothetical protein
MRCLICGSGRQLLDGLSQHKLDAHHDTVFKLLDACGS